MYPGVVVDFDYLDLAAELPVLLPEAMARLREQSARPPPTSAATHPTARRWLPLTGAFAAGVGLATLARRRRRT
jgi:hypothetical protein